MHKNKNYCFFLPCAEDNTTAQTRANRTIDDGCTVARAEDTCRTDTFERAAIEWERKFNYITGVISFGDIVGAIVASAKTEKLQKLYSRGGRKVFRRLSRAYIRLFTVVNVRVLLFYLKKKKKNVRIQCNNDILSFPCNVIFFTFLLFSVVVYYPDVLRAPVRRK